MIAIPLLLVPSFATTWYISASARYLGPWTPKWSDDDLEAACVQCVACLEF